MNNPQKDDYLHAIGEIVVSSNELEHSVALQIAVMIGDDLHVAQRITAGEQFPNLLRMFAALFTYRIDDQKQIAKMENLVRRLDNAYKQRNRFIHRHWIFLEGPTTAPVLTRKLGKTNVKNFENDTSIPSLHTLKELADRMESLRGELVRFSLDNASTTMKHRKMISEIMRSTTRR